MSIVQSSTPFFVTAKVLTIMYVWELEPYLYLAGFPPSFGQLAAARQVRPDISSNSFSRIFGAGSEERTLA